MQRIIAVCLALGLSGPALAQDQTQTLADIRQELTVLWTQIQQLRGELSTTGFPQGAQTGGGPLERLDAIEAQMQRLTAKTEELEFRLDRITRDGTNRIGDLEFRLCELEEGCDIGTLGDTPSLGGVDNAASVPTASVAPPSGPQLAIGEQAQFDAAAEAAASGDFRRAAELFAAFAEAFPGGPLTPQAHYQRGEALEAAADMTNAARAYLNAFTAAPDAGTAPDALFKLGTSLAALGQTQDACTTLAEVPLRFPTSGAALDAQSARANLGCG